MDAKPQIACEITSFSIFFRRRNEHLNIRFPVETNAYSRWKIRNPYLLRDFHVIKRDVRLHSKMSMKDTRDSLDQSFRHPFAACSFLLLSHSPSIIFISPFSPAAKCRQFHRHRHRYRHRYRYRHHHHHHHHPLNLSR